MEAIGREIDRQSFQQRGPTSAAGVQVNDQLSKRQQLERPVDDQPAMDGADAEQIGGPWASAETSKVLRVLQRLSYMDRAH